MKKLISLISASALALSLAVTASAADCESADEAVKNINVGWNVGNTFDCVGDWISGGPSAYETAWGNPVVNKQLIEGVKAAGFNAIRLPVTWDAHIDDKGNIDEAWLDRVQEVVDYIIDADLYCVLNVHHDGGSDGWLEGSAACLSSKGKRFEGLWTNIAERFKDYDEKLIFESFNEVLDAKNSWTISNTSDGYSSVNKLNQMFVDAVRATGGNNKTRNLMVQTYSAGSADATFRNFELPEDKTEGHLIIQVHNYDPQGFTWNDATWTAMTDQWGSEDQLDTIEYLFDVLEDHSEQLGVPVVVGEFGAQSKNNDKERAEYAAFFVSEGAKVGVKCFWWDNGVANEYRIFDRTTGAVTAPLVVKAMLDNAYGAYDANEPGEEEAVKRGDVNGDGYVTPADASAILKFNVGLVELDEKTADFNGDGDVTPKDASDILKYSVGLL